LHITEYTHVFCCYQNSLDKHKLESNQTVLLNQHSPTELCPVWMFLTRSNSSYLLCKGLLRVTDEKHNIRTIYYCHSTLSTISLKAVGKKRRED